MKFLLLPLVLLLASAHVSFSQSIVRFKSSKPYAVLSFVETASGQEVHSSTFKRYIDTSALKNDTAFSSLLNDFGRINLSYNYSREEYPAGRRQTRSTYDLLIIAAVRSNSLREFQENSIGILSNNAHQQLFRVLEKAEPYYDRFVWAGSERSVKDQIIGLKKYEAKANEMFRAFRHLYNSTWPDAIPFDVSVFPIPAVSGNTSATPHANSLCVAVLTGNKDLPGTMGVTLHEICHVLYDEQSGGFQHELDAMFKTSRSPFAAITYGFFDEAMATALGNGYAYKHFTGQIDTTSWYNNPYIDGFAHAIYPLVEDYLAKKKTIDSSFVAQSIELFGKAYPRSLSDYSILLNNMFLYADAEASQDRARLKKIIGKYFSSSRYNFSSPVLHEYSIGYIKKSKATQLIIVDQNQDSTISELKKTLPELEALLKDQRSPNYVVSFFDNTKRPVVLIRVTSEAFLDKAFSLLKQKQYVDPATPLFIVE
ncbi:hypothetical protein LZZ85_22485 [Terrimonas sp. NA20]|uniref:DUF4932 domain-containing protein n=1 Tax=Terrimonas ginsenosidimutans TaxID=2908004 RepID=A0ABS9KXN8_9BACT|nr:hypothetical protein [Terrimonas ginsenosidimutans]MCG2617081.1 hypothetical protein [Terrimonas ginsenosidimutans]